MSALNNKLVKGMQHVLCGIYKLYELTYVD